MFPYDYSCGGHLPPSLWRHSGNKIPREMRKEGLIFAYGKRKNQSGAIPNKL
jgi:hypothetical protein